MKHASHTTIICFLFYTNSPSLARPFVPNRKSLCSELGGWRPVEPLAKDKPSLGLSVAKCSTCKLLPIHTRLRFNDHVDCGSASFEEYFPYRAFDMACLRVAPSTCSPIPVCRSYQSELLITYFLLYILSTPHPYRREDDSVYVVLAPILTPIPLVPHGLLAKCQFVGIRSFVSQGISPLPF